MPRGDQTGPSGYGPMTGRAAGFCAGYSTPGYANFGAGRGVPGPGQAAGFPNYGGSRGGVRGGGRGYRNRFYATGLHGWQQDMAFQAPQPYAPPPYAPQHYTPQFTPQQEVEALREQLKYMEDGIKATQQRISEIEEHKDQE